MLLASGLSTRVKSTSVAKPFILVNHIPLFVYTLWNVLSTNLIHHCFLVVLPNQRALAQRYLAKYNLVKKVSILNGSSSSRNASLAKTVFTLFYNRWLKVDDLVLSHDVVRVFIPPKTIRCHIAKWQKNPNQIIGTIIASNDSYLTLEQTGFIDRSKCYLQQTPQSASLRLFLAIYQKKYDSAIWNQADFCSLGLLNGFEVQTCWGDKANFKLTDDFDLKIMQHLLASW